MKNSVKRAMRAAFAVCAMLIASVTVPASAAESEGPTSIIRLRDLYNESSAPFVCYSTITDPELATFVIDTTTPFWDLSRVTPAPESPANITVSGTDLIVTPNATTGLIPYGTRITGHFTMTNAVTGLPYRCDIDGVITHRNTANPSSLVGPGAAIPAGSTVSFTATLAGGTTGRTGSPNPHTTLDTCDSSVASGDNGNGWLEFSDGTNSAALSEQFTMQPCNVTLHSDTIAYIFPEDGSGYSYCGQYLPVPSGTFTPNANCAQSSGSGATIIYGSVYDDYSVYGQAHPGLYTWDTYASGTATLYTHGSSTVRSAADVDNQLTIDKTGSTEWVDGVDGTDVTYTYDVTSSGGDDVFDVTITDDKCSPVVPVTKTWYTASLAGPLTETAGTGLWPALITNIGDTNHNGFLDTSANTGTDETWQFTCTSNAIKTEVTNTAYAEADSMDTFCVSPYEGPMPYSTGLSWTSNYSSNSGWDLYVDRDFLQSVWAYATASNSAMCSFGAVTTDPLLMINSPTDQWTVRPNVGSLGNYFWHDIDGDGLQSAGEPGIGGVVLTLSNGTDSYTVTTNPDGSYLFADLPSGPYELCVDKTTLPTDYVMTSGDAGADTADSDLVGADSCVSVVMPSDGIDTTWDFGALYDPTIVTTTTSTTTTSTTAPTTTAPTTTAPTTTAPTTTEPTTTAPTTTEPIAVAVSTTTVPVSTTTTAAPTSTTTTSPTATTATVLAARQANTLAKTGTSSALALTKAAIALVLLGTAIGVGTRKRRRNR